MANDKRAARAGDTGHLRISTVPADGLPPDEVLPEIEFPDGRIQRTIRPDGADEALVVVHDPQRVRVLVTQPNDLADSTRWTLERSGWRSGYRSEQVEVWFAETHRLYARLESLAQSTPAPPAVGLN